MGSEERRHYGVTPPILLALPTEAEKRVSENLVEELRRQKTFESAAETQQRCVARLFSPTPRLWRCTENGHGSYKILESLRAIATAFVKRMASEKFADNPMLLEDAHAEVFAFGSFRLGVFGPGSDIDSLVVVPEYVRRVEYFKYFGEMLQNMAPPGAIGDLMVLEDAYVPVIRFKYSGINIDLAFSRASSTQLSADNRSIWKDKSLYRDLDGAEKRSLGGVRTTDELLQLVPEQRTFSDALRAIKLWAKRRAIYGKVMAFPGGVAWTIMVARVCQLFPKAASSVIVSMFFAIIARWPWPSPIVLKPIEDESLEARAWNPKVSPNDENNVP